MAETQSPRPLLKMSLKLLSVYNPLGIYDAQISSQRNWIDHYYQKLQIVCLHLYTISGSVKSSFRCDESTRGVDPFWQLPKGIQLDSIKRLSFLAFLIRSWH